MGLTKSELFTAEQNELATLVKAIAHPARIAILQEVMKTNRCINGGLVEELGLAQATVSQHLKALKEVGLIQGTIEGTSMCYCINPEVWDRFKGQLDGFFDGFQPNEICC